MKIFEFQFNPKAQKDRYFKIFSFEPTKASQNERGSLYIIGELQHALPANTNFLQQLADRIFAEYASSATQTQEKKKSFSPTTSLKASLRKANEFLAAESKKGNTDWLGNLHIAVVLFIPTNGGYTLYFTKVGGMKVWMARNGSLVDVGMNLEKNEDAGSAKVFGSVGSGKIVADDRVAVMSKELFEAFTKENLLQTASQLQEEKQFKELFKGKEKALSKTAGVFLFFFVEPFVQKQEGAAETASLFSGKLPRISVPSIPSIASVPSLASFKALRTSSLALPKMPTVHVLQKLNPGSKLQAFRGIPPLKKALGLIFVLAIILGIGFAVFKGGSFTGTSLEAQTALEGAQTLQFQAEQQLALENEREANKLFQQAWNKTEPYAERNEFIGIRRELETQLQKLNHIEFVSSPELFLTLNTSSVPEIPQKLFAVQDTLYFFHPFTSDLIAIETGSKSQAVLSPGRNLRFGNTFGDTFLFFTDPNLLVSFTETGGWQQQSIQLSQDVQPQGMTSFGQSVYLFNGDVGFIGKVSLANPVVEPWISPSSFKKPLDAVSIAIDGNIWVLLQHGEIQRYFKGQYEESIMPQVFPVLENPTKIYTTAQLPYLYILDAAHARILVLSKFGDIIRQYQSPAFQQATDFAVSADGSTAYVLQGNQVFRIQNIVPE